MILLTNLIRIYLPVLYIDNLIKSMRIPDIRTAIMIYRNRILDLINRNEKCDKELIALNNLLPHKYRVKIKNDTIPYVLLSQIESAFDKFRDDNWRKDEIN